MGVTPVAVTTNAQSGTAGTPDLTDPVTARLTRPRNNVLFSCKEG